ncbi:polcalcin Bra n 2 [Biomphalaria glabrata]|uniref:Uncharacterized protein LOC106058839 n=1 Tax=Biomphalaria glabrata TaxID=6526 RepID=A0A9U8E411_BIOGL|nr:uncharacterized protein LOC106058839 [Biomphalaria glabrata]XP_013071802.2 uncharacterized protein LOC106058839 [Biomphalaria glabrata]KAI8751938.1 polcalcin Bra n 2-like [Biomphalaria glabrata]
MWSLLLCLPLLPSIALSLDLQPHNETAAAAFTATDLNHDGHIDKPEIENLFKLFDTNHDGRVSGDEFMATVRSHQHDARINFIFWSLFNIYDITNNNVVDHIDIDRLFALIDRNGDNVVSRQEYTQYFAHQFELMDKEI